MTLVNTCRMFLKEKNLIVILKIILVKYLVLRLVAIQYLCNQYIMEDRLLDYNYSNSNKRLKDNQTYMSIDKDISLIAKLKSIGIDIEDKADCSKLIGLMQGNDLMGVRRVQSLVDIKVRRRIERYETNKQHEEYLGIGLLSGVIFKEVLNNIEGNSSAIGKYSFSQVVTLVQCWIHSKINNNIFTKDNVSLYPLPFKSRIVGECLKDLRNNGILAECDYLEVNRMTGKSIPAHLKGRYKTHYKLLRAGDILMQDFFKEYSKQFERLTGQFWDVGLIELLNEKTKEEF